MWDLKTWPGKIVSFLLVVAVLVIVGSVVYGLTHLGSPVPSGPSVVPVTTSAPSQLEPSLGDLLLPPTTDAPQQDSPFDEIFKQLLAPPGSGPSDNQSPTFQPLPPDPSTSLTPWDALDKNFDHMNP